MSGSAHARQLDASQRNIAHLSTVSETFLLFLQILHDPKDKDSENESLIENYVSSNGTLLEDLNDDRNSDIDNEIRNLAIDSSQELSKNTDIMNDGGDD